MTLFGDRRLGALTTLPPPQRPTAVAACLPANFGNQQAQACRRLVLCHAAHCSTRPQAERAPCSWSSPCSSPGYIRGCAARPHPKECYPTSDCPTTGQITVGNPAAGYPTGHLCILLVSDGSRQSSVGPAVTDPPSGFHALPERNVNNSLVSYSVPSYQRPSSSSQQPGPTFSIQSRAAHARATRFDLNATIEKSF